MKIIFGIIVIGLVGVGVFLLQGDSLSVQNNVPDTALENHALGDEVVLADRSGLLVINSWAVWCPFCVKEVPDFVTLQEEFPEVEIILVNRGESKEKVGTFLSEIGVTTEQLTFLHDASDSFYRAIGGFSMPETLFVRDGEIVFHKRGVMDLFEMRDLTNKLIEGTL